MSTETLLGCNSGTDENTQSPLTFFSFKVLKKYILFLELEIPSKSAWPPYIIIF